MAHGCTLGVQRHCCSGTTSLPKREPRKPFTYNRTCATKFDVIRLNCLLLVGYSDYKPDRSDLTDRLACLPWCAWECPCAREGITAKGAEIDAVESVESIPVVRISIERSCRWLHQTVVDGVAIEEG